VIALGFFMSINCAKKKRSCLSKVVMNSWRMVRESFRHYWRTNLAILLGVATATAVLTGALLVGESMRTSLRDLTLDRLGNIDEMIVSQGFFRQALADEIAASSSFESNYDLAVPAILFTNGTVEWDLGKDGFRRATNVNVFGVTDAFWNLGRVELNVQPLTDEAVVINQTLASELGISSDDSGDDAEVVLRIPKPTQLPAESSLGVTTELVESFVGLKVAQVIPDKGLGRFGMHPSQVDGPNLYLPIGLLQDALARKALKHKQDLEQANVIFIGGQSEAVPDEAVSEALKKSLRPSLQDYGLSLKLVSRTFDEKSVFKYWSLSSERLVLEHEASSVVTSAFPSAKPMFTYLANDIRRSDNESGIPFSMIASIDFDSEFQPTSAITGEPINPIANGEIVLNEWAAADLGDLKPGDAVVVSYFEPETTHGNQVEKSVTLTVADVAKLTAPSSPFDTRRGEKFEPAFDAPPTIANDPDLTPEVPGVTDSESIDNWDLPFETAGKLRPQDDEYWDYYRTTPKAFVSLATGQELWSSRFGKVTSFRIPCEASTDNSEKAALENAINQQIADSGNQLGFEFVPIKRDGMKASSGSTPFDGLFLALSMFVILSALILVSLLFRLALQSRVSEVGLLQAVGWTRKQIFNVWLKEMMLVCVVGSLVGVAAGIGYAALMVLGLKTWWVGAISNPFIELHVGPVSMIVGLLSGILICIVTIWWSLRQIRREPTRGLLAGQLESTGATSERNAKRSSGKWMPMVIIGLFVIAIGLAFLATTLAGDAQAGSFMGSGFCVLAGLLLTVYRHLKSQSNAANNSQLSLAKMAGQSNRRNPLRSTLTVGLVAVASFLIAAVSSFRLSPTDAGTAGFDFVGQTSQPVFADLNSSAGQTELLGAENHLPTETELFGFRVKPGQDASCNNLYQATQPKVLGVPQSFIDRFDDESSTPFAWGGSVASSLEEKANPWQLLNREIENEPDAIPVIIDKNTANYSLKIFAPGGNYEVEFDSGEKIKFHVVGFLSNTILQGGLLVSEDNFKKAFPYIGGSRYFLIDTTQSNSDTGADKDTVSATVQSPAIATLENRLGDQGFDAQSADRLLSRFMAVQNTYLSTFQSLGAFGLLLGTFGLAAVQVRSVLERKQELGLMRAVGFRRSRLSKMILIENAWLLFVGLAIGIVAAICSTLPHFLFGDASIPWLSLAWIFGMIVLVGLAAGFLASRTLGRIPLLESLRS
jgi:ABC-type antimicrobial peptide transport system permease subunit